MKHFKGSGYQSLSEVLLLTDRHLPKQTATGCRGG